MADDKKDPDFHDPTHATDAEANAQDNFEDDIYDEEFLASIAGDDDAFGLPEAEAPAAPDPGYAAYASELEDPLADWPSPETPLDDLPEMRQYAKDTAEDAIEYTAVAVPEPEPEPITEQSAESVAQVDSIPSTAPSAVDFSEDFGTETDATLDDPLGDPLDEPLEELVEDPLEDPQEEPLQELAEEPAQELLEEPVREPAQELIEEPAQKLPDPSIEAPDAKAPEAHPEEYSEAPLEGPAEVPIEEPLNEGVETGDTPVEFVSVDPTENVAAMASAASASPIAEAVNDVSSVDFGNDASENLAPEEAQTEDPEEEFVDDFLNDLDEVDDGFVSSDTVTKAAAAGVAMGGSERFDESSGDTPSKDGGPPATGGRSNGGENAGSDENAQRKFPIAMIAVVLVAVALLAIGGFGVVQQRSEMQAEIRDLQAQLAVTMTPEEAALERERQRQVEGESERLNSEIVALGAENIELKEQLQTLEAQLGERQAAREAASQLERQALADAQAVAEAKAQAERVASEARASAASASAQAQSQVQTAPTGIWFVNFGSYAQRDVAESWATRINSDAGRVVVQSATAGGRTLFRVRVVDLSSQDSAERVATQLERQYKLPRLWVGKSE